MRCQNAQFRLTADPVDSLNKCSAESCTDTSQCKQGQTHYEIPEFFFFFRKPKFILKLHCFKFASHCIWGLHYVMLTVCPLHSGVILLNYVSFTEWKELLILDLTVSTVGSSLLQHYCGLVCYTAQKDCHSLW